MDGVRVKTATIVNDSGHHLIPQGGYKFKELPLGQVMSKLSNFIKGVILPEDVDKERRKNSWRWNNRHMEER